MENENYEEHSFSVADFGKESHRVRNMVIAAAVAVVVLAAMFLALTATGW
jgi:hypothetical protein